MSMVVFTYNTTFLMLHQSLAKRAQNKCASLCKTLVIMKYASFDWTTTLR